MRKGGDFADLSLVSGVDDLSDARSFALLDFDRDGWVDIALLSLNAPRFKLYRNNFGTRFPDNRVLQVRLIGGNESAEPTSEFSNRNAIGARVRATYESGKSTVIHKQAGEGFSSQNSATLRLGIAQSDAILRLDILWPSGKKTVVENPNADTVLEIRERDSTIEK